MAKLDEPLVVRYFERQCGLAVLPLDLLVRDACDLFPVVDTCDQVYFPLAERKECNVQERLEDMLSQASRRGRLCRCLLVCYLQFQCNLV